MTSQIAIHDYQVPEVTFEEADTIARNVFGNSMISPDFADKIRLILEDDRERVADLQDPWVEVPEGATIPEGAPCRGFQYAEGETYQTDHASEDDTMIPAHKGFNRDLTCRGFQYAEGETYQTDRAELCATGFHACPMPLDTLRYYPPGTSIYHAVEVDADAHRGDDKMVSKRIKIGGRMSLAELIDAHLSLTFKRADQAEGTDESTAVTSGYRSTAVTSGYRSTAAASGGESTAVTSGYRSTAAASGSESTAVTSGYRSTAAASGGESTAVTSGYRSTAVTSGYRSTAAASGSESTAVTSGHWSTAATSGHRSMAKVEGEHSIAVAGGYQCRAAGSLGCWLVLAERDINDAIAHLKAVQVDGERIKPDVAYMLRNGRVVEA